LRGTRKKTHTKEYLLEIHCLLSHLLIFSSSFFQLPWFQMRERERERESDCLFVVDESLMEFTEKKKIQL
jgi:hypothetical protein